MNTLPLDADVYEIIGGDPVALAELERLTDAGDGELEAAAVLEAARPKRSPLHKHFEWDNGVAAESWRMYQARKLVQCYKLHTISNGVERTLRYYTNVESGGRRAYRRTEEVMKIEHLREQRRVQLERELNRIHGELVTWEGYSSAAQSVADAIRQLRHRG